MIQAEGGCLCGEIRYVVEDLPTTMGACHCRDCQHVSGGGPAHVLGFAALAVVITKGSPQAYAVLSEAGRKVSRFFCGTCGTQLFRRGSGYPELTYVASGTLDAPDMYRPQLHAWTRSARRWHDIDSHLPCFPCEAPDERSRVA